MPQKLSDFVAEFNMLNTALNDREATKTKLMDRSVKAFTFFTRHSNSKVFLKNKKVLGDIEVLITTDMVLGEVVPSRAEFRAFSRDNDLGYYRTDATKTLVAWSPDDEPDDVVGAQPLNIAEYYNGKVRTATNGAITFQCTITIPMATWQAVQRLDAGIGIRQIEGILQQDPILITQRSKMQGVRCIKPEPYGWIFSTSVSTRLVAKNVPPTTVNPAALNFSDIESGH